MTYILTVDIGKGLSLDVDLDKVAPHKKVYDHALCKGFKPLLQDCHANVTITKEDAAIPEKYKAYQDASLALAEKKRAAMYDGTMRIVGESRLREPADPIGREAMRLARVAVFGICGNWVKDDSHKEKLVAFATANELPFESTDNLKEAYAEMIAIFGDMDDTQTQAKRNLEGASTLKAFDVTKLVRKAKTS
jgi:hypothetical protein